MDACANFTMNGDILVVPCPWEDDKVVTNGERVHYRGGIEVEPDGRTRVKRYNVGMNGPMHDVLFETTHGAVKITRPLYRKNDDGYGHRAGCRLIGRVCLRDVQVPEEIWGCAYKEVLRGGG